MHSSTLLKSDDFEFLMDGRSGGLAGVVPGFTALDRLGVVMAGPTDGLGASNFILACVTAFYDEYRGRGEAFFTYPDYFTFQASEAQARYGGLDIWPDHKDVPVARDPEAILRAVNDRGITLLLVPDGVAGAHVFDRVSLSSARRRVRACFAYGADGEVRAPDLRIRRRAGPVDAYLGRVFDTVADERLREERRAAWTGRRGDGDWTEETYRTVCLEEALALMVF